MPQNIYDDPTFFAGYSQFRRSVEGLAGAPEWPSLRAMLPPLAGLRVLDLGCGFGAFVRWAYEQGAASVLGIDLSEKMLAEARQRTPYPNVQYRRGDIEQVNLPDGAFDLIYSSLALHYIEDYAGLCATLHCLLVPQGHLVFSVEHPIYSAPTPQQWIPSADGGKAWPISNYLVEGKRVTNWISDGIVKYHRSVGSYVNGLIDHGFTLRHLEEWGPTPEQLAIQPDLADELQRPTFMLVSAQA